MDSSFKNESAEDMAIGFVAIEQATAKQTSWIGDLQVNVKSSQKDSSHHVRMHCLQEIPNNLQGKRWVAPTLGDVDCTIGPPQQLLLPQCVKDDR